MRARRVRADMVLDLTPVLSLIVHLLPMLLILVRFQQLARIELAQPPVPTLAAPTAAAFAEQTERLVSVAIGPEGFAVGGLAGTPPVLPCEGPCLPDGYPYEGLGRVLEEARRQHPSEARVVVAPHAEVPFDVVVRVMDVTRGPPHAPLFSQPVLAAPSAP